MGADEQIGTDTVEEAESLIQELLDAGFAYEPNDRLSGFAHQAEEETTETTEEPETPEEPTETPETGEEETTETTEEPETPTPSAEGGPFSTLTSEEQAALVQLRQMLVDNPDIAASVTEQFEAKRTGKPAVVAAPETPELPPYIDPDDEAQVAMYRKVEGLEHVVADADARAERAEVDAAQAKMSSEIGQAVARFREAHPDLTDEDIVSIRNHTSAEVNVAGVMANYPTDPIEGLTKALEVGSMSDPETRDKVLGVTKSRQDHEDKARKGKLGSLAGSTGSGTRRPAPAKPAANYQEAVQRIAREIESMGPTS